MKKFLLGMIALFAVTAVAGTANAADQGVKLGLGGYYKNAFGVIVDEDDDATQPQAVNRRGHSLKQDVEVWFAGETTLDNGITVGARVELEGQTNGDQIDETWMYMKGSFGELRVGDEDDARRLKGVVGPQASKVFSTNNVDGTALTFSNSPLITLAGNSFAANNAAEIGTNTTLPSVENDSTKLIYMTPSFNGFSLAVSYAPDASQDKQNVAGATDLDNNGGNSEAWSIAGAYDGKFDNVKVMASLGYTNSDNETAGFDDVKAWSAGVALGFNQFMVGASYTKMDNAFDAVATDDFDYTAYEISGTYETGPYTIGLGWSHGKYELAAAQEPELDTFMLSGAYAIGPGITLDAAVQYNDYDNDGAGAVLGATTDYKSTAVMVGSSIKF